jgi:hypothetical protein
MSEKMYTILQAEELRKRYQDTTHVLLKSDGWNSNGVSVGNGNIELSYKDALCPDLNQLYLVTIEPITVPKDEHISDYGKKLIAQRQEQEAAKVLPNTGRKFR